MSSNTPTTFMFGNVAIVVPKSAGGDDTVLANATVNPTGSVNATQDTQPTTPEV